MHFKIKSLILALWRILELYAILWPFVDDVIYRTTNFFEFESGTYCNIAFKDQGTPMLYAFSSFGGSFLTCIGSADINCKNGIEVCNFKGYYPDLELTDW